MKLLRSLLALGNNLDSAGYTKYAKHVDNIIAKFSQDLPEGFEWSNATSGSEDDMQSCQEGYQKLTVDKIKESLDIMLRLDDVFSVSRATYETSGTLGTGGAVEYESEGGSGDINNDQQLRDTLIALTKASIITPQNMANYSNYIAGTYPEQGDNYDSEVQGLKATMEAASESMAAKILEDANNPGSLPDGRALCVQNINDRNQSLSAILAVIQTTYAASMKSISDEQVYNEGGRREIRTTDPRRELEPIDMEGTPDF